MRHDIIIVGAGVSGTALLYALSNYSDVKDILLIDKYAAAGTVNSSVTSNSQTLHFGDIETNYGLEKAKAVKRKAEVLRNYLEKVKTGKDGTPLFTLYRKMVLAVGKKQVDALRVRHREFKDIFPELRLIGRDEIARLEPKVIEGRPWHEPVAALASPHGYTVDYQALARSFITLSHGKISYSTKLKSIERIRDGFILRTDRGILRARAVVIAAGGHSIVFARQLGYAEDYSILSVAGSFYTAPSILNGKVYTPQVEKLPFAAIHGDPDVHRADETRFGPTAKPIPLLERHHRGSLVDYLRIAATPRSLIALFSIIGDWTIFSYVARNALYDLPFIGKRLFLKEVRRIVPGLKDITYAKGVGGTRPQLVNMKTRKLEMGEAKFTGENIIFNITPSPGASTCLYNAYLDAQTVSGFLSRSFDNKRFEKDFGLKPD